MIQRYPPTSHLVIYPTPAIHPGGIELESSPGIAGIVAHKRAAKAIIVWIGRLSRKLHIVIYKAIDTVRGRSKCLIREVALVDHDDPAR